MSKDWNAARRELKEALQKQQAELDHHKKALEVFQNVVFDSHTPDVVANIAERAIATETRKIRSLERNIRDIQRDLKTKYSLAVA